MTQEQKQILLKDLSARQPYGVILKTPQGDGYLNEVSLSIFGHKLGINIKATERTYFKLEEIKPLLRPMSSITEEEEKEYRKTMDKYTHRLYPDSADFSEHTEYSWTTETFDFLNAHHFDYRGLIPMGLANEAPEGMYNIN